MKKTKSVESSIESSHQVDFGSNPGGTHIDVTPSLLAPEMLRCWVYKSLYIYHMNHM